MDRDDLIRMGEHPDDADRILARRDTLAATLTPQDCGLDETPLADAQAWPVSQMEDGS